ncbi:chemotaxis protein CheA [Spirochaeta africana]|uniref:Chemotaxis protein CheA n=1 Tax=Spirochaeta africana (strain ATCC 700263 / DSM 8902 / Z-7692) TaxID=889378 RepID=H9ULL3_SPIAZ|nr:chemotaxis protein CheA [Spirochaeta africana]AFG38406.1 chemotaxis protein histidine kinase-like protein [Spirochaeta africana DSM 8902]
MKTETDPLEIFREEAAEILSEFEQTLINLEEAPANLELVDAAFRHLHTLKGAASMFGFNGLVEVTHLLEALFEQIRNTGAAVSSEAVSTALRSRDEITRLVQAALDGAGDDTANQSIIADITRLMASGADAAGSTAGSGGSGQAPAGVLSDDAPGEQRSTRTFRIEYTPHPDVLKNGGNPLSLLQELGELGTTLVIGFCSRVPELAELDPEQCYIGWEILITTDRSEDELRDVFLFAQDSRKLEFVLIDAEELGDSNLSYKRLGELLVERGDIQPDQLASVMQDRDFLGQLLVEKGYVTGERLQSALEEQQYVRKLRETRQKVELSSTIKVRTDKLSALVNLVGELGTLHARMGLLAHRRQDEDMFTVSEQLESMLRQLRELAMEMHMVPVGLLFNGFRRLVRDLAADLGKEVRLVQEGTEAELDKNVLDKLKDPLLHIIRNSIDHGIESPARRRELGKPEEGTLTLRAQYSGASVLIEVQDDGAGLNSEKIRAKAVERGLIDAGQELSQEEIYDLIFEPGFSTADVATNVSGRGVGMDVVRSNLESISGSVSIRSEPGQGSTLSLRIPLTLAILEGLLAPVAGQRYLVNLANVVECVDLAEYDHDEDAGLVTYRGSKLPLLNIARMFGFSGQAESVYMLVVTNGQRKLGLAIDAVPSSYQGVVKPLGRMFSRHEGFSGAVMLGDGTPALVLDVERLFR